MRKLFAGLIAALIAAVLFAMPFQSSVVAAVDPIECDKAGSEECKQDGDGKTRVRDMRGKDGCPDGKRLVRVMRMENDERVETFECRAPTQRRARDNGCPDGQVRVRVRDNRDGESSSSARTVCRDKESLERRRGGPRPEENGDTPARADAAGIEGARDMGDVPTLSADAPTPHFTCNGIGCECDPTVGDSYSDGWCGGMEDFCKARGAGKPSCHWPKDKSEPEPFCVCIW